MSQEPDTSCAHGAAFRRVRARGGSGGAGARGRWAARGGGPVTALEPNRLERIGNQIQGIARRAITPVTEGVAAHSQHGHTGGEIKAVATAVGVISGGSTPQAPEQLRHIEPPAHQPQGFFGATCRLLEPQQIGEKRMIRLPLPVGHQLHTDKITQQAGRLQLHQQPATAEAAGGAGNKNANPAQRELA